jgi:hypothetical protein
MRRVISVEDIGDSRYRVTVDEGDSRTVHDVGASTADVARYAPGVPPDRLIEASFHFLLEREPKEAILTRFDLPVIERYFPDYRRAIGNKLKG